MPDHVRSYREATARGVLLVSAIPLRELEGHWTTRRKKEWPEGVTCDVLVFLCPTCPRNSAGGVHAIAVNVTEGLPIYESGAVWKIAAGAVGSIDDLRLLPSVDCTPGGGCTFHGHVGLTTPGMVEW